MSGRFILDAHRESRGRALAYIAEAPSGWIVTVKPPKRTVAQNDKMWAVLADLAAQVVWHGQKLTKEEWKDAITAALKQQKVIPGITGGFVVLGAHTSTMTKDEMSNVIEFAHAFGAERDVTFSDPQERVMVRQPGQHRKPEQHPKEPA